MKPALAFAIMLTCSSCGDFPRDPEGTLERIRSERMFKVGLVAPLTAQGASQRALLDRVGRATSARPEVSTGDAEPLLKQLEEGELDVVIGRFDKKSPWSASVEIGPALTIQQQGKAEIHLAPVMRTGENAWIALIEAEARNVAGEAR